MSGAIIQEIAQRYRRLADRMTKRIDALTESDWSRPTPCDGWTVRDLVDHLVQAQHLFRKLAGFPPVDAGDLDADPAGAWRIAHTTVQADLDDPARATTEFDGLRGRYTFAQAVDRFLVFDLIIHGWDLARALGRDEDIPDEDLAHVSAQADQLGELMYTSGQFRRLDAPPDADPQTRLLARLGRRR